MTKTLNAPLPRRTEGPEPGTPMPAVVRGEPVAAYRLSALAAVLLAITSLAGLLYGTRGLYQADPALLPQFLAQDAVGLALALPLLVGSMALARRGSARGVLLWAAMLFYLVYWYYFYLAGVRFGPLFLVHAALVASSLFALLALLARLDPDAVRVRFSDRFPHRVVASVLLLVGGAFALLWIVDIARRTASGEELGMVPRAVYAIDLVLMLPAAIAVGLGLWRRSAWGYTLAGVVLVKIVATMVMLLVTAAFVSAHGQPVSGGEVAEGAVTALAALACAIVYFRGIGASSPT